MRTPVTVTRAFLSQRFMSRDQVYAFAGKHCIKTWKIQKLQKSKPLPGRQKRINTLLNVLSNDYVYWKVPTPNNLTFYLEAFAINYSNIQFSNSIFPAAPQYTRFLQLFSAC